MAVRPSSHTNLHFEAAHHWYVHIVRGRTYILVLFPGEYVDTDQVHLGVTMFPRLGGGHFDDLARAALQHDEAVLAEGRALLRERRAGTGVALAQKLVVEVQFSHCVVRSACTRGETELEGTSREHLSSEN